MTLRGLLAGLLVCAAGFLAGCGGGEYSPFEGDWVSATAGRLSFDTSDWWDSDGDRGSYSFSGEYPVYRVTFRSAGGEFVNVATFADTRTFELCDLAADGALVNCDTFVFDKPTVH